MECMTAVALPPSPLPCPPLGARASRPHLPSPQQGRAGRPRSPEVGRGGQGSVKGGGPRAMSFPRRVEPALLAQLPADDPRAIRALRDVRRANTLMI